MTAADPADELVALYDPATGRPSGSAPRSVVRAQNLPHGATGVLLRRSDGQVFVHRRSDGKDLWPARHDCACGGVIHAGEDPTQAAARELAEELGVRGASLTPLLQSWYRDPDTWYHAFVFDAVWDGPVSFDDGEVAEGWWEPVPALRARLTDPDWPFVPDTRRLLDQLPDWPGAPDRQQPRS
jgi:8-oxo-dGTP pyrophosphatase MutT (NUDIX family)